MTLCHSSLGSNCHWFSEEEEPGLLVRLALCTLMHHYSYTNIHVAFDNLDLILKSSHCGHYKVLNPKAPAEA